ncbi:MAG: hypothetical protein IJ715_03245 [Bacilli bacterium]|nr:hypothetical protein [Bacilli bacterium]
MITYNDYGIMSANTEELGIWAVISFVAAIVGGIILYFTFLSKNNDGEFEGFKRKLYDFLNFKTLTIEALLKICYLITSIFITLISLGLIGTSFIAFIMLLIFGNLMIRVTYEFALLIILIYRNVKELNEKK